VRARGRDLDKRREIERIGGSTGPRKSLWSGRRLLFLWEKKEGGKQLLAPKNTQGEGILWKMGTQSRRCKKKKNKTTKKKNGASSAEKGGGGGGGGLALRGGGPAYFLWGKGGRRGGSFKWGGGRSGRGGGSHFEHLTGCLHDWPALKG